MPDYSVPPPARAKPRALFLVGRDVRHPKAAGGDLQAWEWAKVLAADGWEVTFVAQGAPQLSARDYLDNVNIVRHGQWLHLLLGAWRTYLSCRKGWALIYEDPIGARRMPYLSPLMPGRPPIIAVWHQVSTELITAMRGPVIAAPLSWVERRLASAYRNCLFWAPSAESADAVSRELNIERARISVIPPTLARSTRLASPTTPRDRNRFLCMGVIREYKNFDHALRALDMVRKTNPLAHLIIAGRVGSESCFRELRQLASHLGVTQHVKFLTDVTDDERQQLMASAGALVLPSRLEGFGIVSIEANAEGTPVVASSGVPTGAVESGLNGLRFEWGNINQLSEAMRRCLNDHLLWQRMHEGAFLHAKGLTVEAVAPRFRSLVAKAVGPSAS